MNTKLGSHKQEGIKT